MVLFPNSGNGIPLQRSFAVQIEVGVTPQDAGVTPWKFRGNAVENSALPRGNFGVTPWKTRRYSSAANTRICF